MAKPNRHLIAQQILQLDVASVSHAPGIQQSIAQRLRTHTLVDIEALFDRFVSPDQTLRLERVEINLGKLTGADWQEQFESRLVTQLARVVQQASGRESDQSSHSEFSQDEVEQFLYFLQHGRLPYWAKTPEEDWPHALLQRLDIKQWQTLQALLTSNMHATQRFIHTLDNSMLATVVERHVGLREVLDVLDFWYPAELPPAQRLSWRTQFWQALLASVQPSDELERGIVFVRRLLKLQMDFDMLAPNELVNLFITQELPEPWRGWFSVILQNHERVGNVTYPDYGDPETKDMQSKVATAQSSGRETAESEGSRVASIKPFHETKDRLISTSDDKLVEVKETIPVNGAGCIILHPFLPELFQHTNLLDERDFRDEASRARAVCLLSRLTYGDEAAPEYELLLPKLLCNMAWEEPLPPIELTPAEKTACDELLDAVLGHWQALRNCSANWMREQFFLRPATLAHVDGGWNLNVERRAQDVLLDRLPWGLGVIALPWRQELIYVHWLS